MAGGFALLPQPPFAAAEEHCLTSCKRCSQSIAIHVAEHEHRAGLRVLHDGRQQAIALAKVESLQVCEVERFVAHAILEAADSGRPAVRRTGTPAAFSCCFRSPMRISPVWKTLAASAPSARASVST